MTRTLFPFPILSLSLFCGCSCVTWLSREMDLVSLELCTHAMRADIWKFSLILLFASAARARSSLIKFSPKNHPLSREPYYIKSISSKIVIHLVVCICLIYPRTPHTRSHSCRFCRRRSFLYVRIERLSKGNRTTNERSKKKWSSVCICIHRYEQCKCLAINAQDQHFNQKCLLLISWFHFHSFLSFDFFSGADFITESKNCRIV